MHLEPNQLVTHAQLARQGLTANDIRKRLRNGELERLRRGVYRPTTTTLSTELLHRQLVRATLTEVHSSTVISHLSAGVLHQLPVPIAGLDRVWATRRTSGHGKRSHHLVTRTSPLDDDEVTRLGDFPVTTLARTASDLARTSPFAWGVMAVDAALHQGLALEDLLPALERHPRLHGLNRARSVVEFADERSESAAESMSRVSMALAGIPVPATQFEIVDDAGQFVARADFAWPELKLVGEMDGKGKYADLLAPGESVADVVMREKLREERIRQAGYWIVRWDWKIACDATALGALLRRAMGLQRRQLGLIG